MCSGRSSDFRFILLPRLPISPMETVALLRDLSPGTAAGPFRHQTGFPFHPLIRTPEAMWTPIYPPPPAKSSREWRGHGENRPFARGCAPTVGEAQGERPGLVPKERLRQTSGRRRSCKRCPGTLCQDSSPLKRTCAVSTPRVSIKAIHGLLSIFLKKTCTTPYPLRAK